MGSTDRHRRRSGGGWDRCRVLGGLGVRLRGLRRAARTSDARPRVRSLLALDSSSHAAALRLLRRSASDLARPHPAARSMPALSSSIPNRRSRAGDRCVRRSASRDRPRAEVRRAAIARVSARRPHAGSLRRSLRGRNVCRTGAAPPIAAPRARIQSGGRPRAASRPSGATRAQAHPGDADPNEPSGGPASQKRSRRFCADPPRTRASRRDRSGPCRRCQYDGSDAGGVRSHIEAGRGPRGSRRYGSESRDVTALSTSAATASLSRSPSTTTQPGCDAWRR